MWDNDLRVHFSLYGRMLSLQALYVAYKQVKKNRGAAGIDGQSIDDFTQMAKVGLVLPSAPLLAFNGLALLTTTGSSATSHRH